MSNVTIIGSFSEIDTFRQCPHKHELAYKQRWTKRTSSPALTRGTAFHKVMEGHYTRIKDGELTPYTANEVRAELGPDTDDETYELIQWMYDGYVEMYGTDPHWQILAVEHDALCWLPTTTGSRSGFKLKLKIDLVVKELRTGNIHIVDHKTCKDLPKQKAFEIDDQFGLYTWALQKLGKRVFGSVHNACRTFQYKDPNKPYPLDERFKRTPMYRTNEELETIAVEAWKTLKRAYAIKPGEAERAPDTDRCGWRCDYMEACLAGRKGIDEFEFLQSTGFVIDHTRH